MKFTFYYKKAKLTIYDFYAFMRLLNGFWGKFGQRESDLKRLILDVIEWFWLHLNNINGILVNNI